MTQFTGTIDLRHITDRLDKLEKSHAEILKAINGPKPEQPAPEVPKPDPIPTTVDPKITDIWSTDFQNVPLTGIEKSEQLKRAFHGTGHSSKVGDWWF